MTTQGSLRKPLRQSGWSTESSTKRGYDYSWQRLRLRILERDCYLCQCSECMGGQKRLLVANEVNHIVSKAEARRKGWTREQMDDPSNLQSVNGECHVRIGLEQRGMKSRPQVSEDGWPI